MKTVVINRFDGGVEEPRSVTQNAGSSSRHFLLSKTKLKPYRDMVTESIDTGTFANYNVTDVTRFTPTGGNEQIFALGNTNGFSYPQFLQKSTVNSITASFQTIANGADTSGTVIPGTLIGYKGALYCLKTKSSQTYLVKHIFGTSTTEIGAIGASPTNGVVPKMFIHPKDNRLYAATGYTMMSYDGTAISTRDFSTGHNITAITHYGNNIVIGMVSKDTNSSVLGIWNGSTTSSELVDVVLFGDDTLMVLENLGDIIVGVSAPTVGGGFDAGVENNITIRAYAGGAAQVIKKLPSVGLISPRVFPFKAKRNDVLYFPMTAYLNSERVYQIWSLSKNELGSWSFQPDRKVYNNTEIVNENITGMSIIGDMMWVSWSGGKMYRTNTNDYYTSTSSYSTTINPKMETGDRTKNKQLKSVSVICGSPTSVAHDVTISYSIDAGSTWHTICSSTSSEVVRVIEAANQSDNSPMLDGRDYMFKVETTGNGEIYEFKYSYDTYQTLI